MKLKSVNNLRNLSPKSLSKVSASIKKSWKIKTGMNFGKREEKLSGLRKE